MVSMFIFKKINYLIIELAYEITFSKSILYFAMRVLEGYY